MSKAPIRVLQYGLGPIGIECARTILTRRAAGSVELVGAVDIDPEKAGQDLGGLTGSDRSSGIVVSDDPEKTLAETGPEVVLHATRSSLAEVSGQIERCLSARAHVISSTEELLFPFDRHPGLSAKLDELAREHGVVALGTGVNPGFVMDTLALMATGVCRDVRHLRVVRVVDAARRRAPLQRKVGAGLAVEQFEEHKQRGAIGHVGLVESLRLVAHGLGWRLDRVEERLDPKLAREPVETPVVSVRPGQVAGIHHTASGHVDGREVIALDLQMYVGAEDPHDAIHVEGDPPIDLTIHGGVFGDTATVAALVNSIPLVRTARPGLRTMADLPVLRAFATARH